MLRIHMRLPQIARLPVLIEQEVRGIFVVLVQVVFQASRLGAGDQYHLQMLSLFQVNFVGVGCDIGDDSQAIHFHILRVLKSVIREAFQHDLADRPT